MPQSSGHIIALASASGRAEPLAGPHHDAMERIRVAEVIQRERAARDGARWTEMASYYHPDCVVNVAWFQGDGLEFVRATERNWRTDAINFHQVGEASVTVCGPRAIAETSCTLHGFYKLDGTDVTSTGFVRLHWRMQRPGTCWLIAGLRCSYVRDTLEPCNPSARIALDDTALRSYRPSYRFLTATLRYLGRSPSGELPGVDRPDSIRALAEAEQAWLADTGVVI